MAFLDGIVAEKEEEARLRRAFTEVTSPDPFRKRRSLEEAVAGPGMSFICELKRASPSEGRIVDADAAEVARAYESAGASAISVLTDMGRFGGRLEDVSAVKHTVDVPVLRKDFIVHRRQVRDALFYGADAVLLIAAILREKTADFVDFAGYVGLECLVEVHDERDLSYALKSGSPLIGVNNRDLATMKVDLSTFERLATMIPDDRLVVAESGIRTRRDVERMSDAGADAVLVGTSLMRSKNPGEKLGELMG